MSVNLPKNSTNDDIAAAKAFVQNPQEGLKFDDSSTVASAIIKEVSLFGEQNGVTNNEGTADRETFKYYIASTYSSEIAQYYMDNGVEFNNKEEYVDSILNTGKLIAFSLDVDNSGDISTEEIMAALSFADNIDENYKNSQAGLLEYMVAPDGKIEFSPESTSGDISNEEFEHLFNILTTGEGSFSKYNEESYEAKLEDAIKTQTFDNQIESPFMLENDLRTQACAKLREGEQNIKDEDYDAIIRLLNYNHAISLIYENEQNKQN